MMESTTATKFPMPAEPTACSGPAVMASSMPWKNATMASSMPTPPMLADPGAAFPNAETESSIRHAEKPAMTEISSTETDALAHAKRSAVTDASILEKLAMTVPATTTPSQLAADSTANCPDVVMVLPILERNAMMPEPTLPDPTPADLIAPCQNAVMVLLIICTVNSATKDLATL